MSQYPPPYSDPQAVPALPYAAPMATTADLEHLKLLAIFHWILGPIQLLFGLFPLIYLAVGLMFISGAIPADKSTPDPAMIGWIFVAFSTIGTLIAWAFGVLTLYSGFQIRNRRRRLFSLIVAGLNCLHFPFGTALGIFTLIVLLRRSVEDLYRPTART